MKKFYTYSLLYLALFFASPVWAGGFFIPEQSAKAAGMANAFVAIADDASANWYNPAGLAFLANNSLQLGSNIVSPENDYTLNGTTYQAERMTFIIPHAYVVYHLDSPISLGFAVNAPFGLSTDWSKSSTPFSQLAAAGDSVTLSEIEAVHSNMNIAYQIDDTLALAMGVSYYDVRKVNLDSQATLIGGAGDGFGSNIALLYKHQDVHIGISYRSEVKVAIDGVAIGGPLLAGFNLQGVSSAVTTSITLPDSLSLGLTFFPANDISIALQMDWVNWATFDQIELLFKPSALNGATGTSAIIPENWSATTTYRMAVLWDYADDQRIRAGYVYDPTPTNDADLSPRLPGADRSLLTLGYGYDWSDRVTIDVAYAYVQLDDRQLNTANKTVYNGLYEASAQLFLASWSYVF